MNRLLLLPGYLEDSTIFDTLRPHLPPAAEVLALELEPEFAQWRPAGPANVVTFARHLVQRYGIGPTDVLIGHSMGGWITAHLRAQTGAAAILLSSFTDQRKIVATARHPLLLAFYAWSGVGGSRWLRQRAKRRYQFDESRELYARLADSMARYPRRYVHRQLQVLFAPVPPLALPPNLRVHARRDNVILPPDEAFVEIPGDHFAHYYHPQRVAAAIGQLGLGG
ncbi:alpha/beta fold hydrolase [Hymenobacter sp. HMF4947]|uniref:Alpha/beta fold hydrolase n=1 Tax=Hymenobacter ginkgonis TaxID=2682976 RepID=A0A7K1TBC7_9BACT|nr:alpha/beta hydrolase [Hymenobacter ginkgonis]MVN75710.1 alpha/beta fold hydrolase [Hymenobacter ginkgonis]